MPDAILFLSPYQSVYHASYLLSAFAALKRYGWRLSIRLEPSAGSSVARLSINGTLYGIDLHDSDTRYCASSLARCDFYAKRSYNAAKAPAAHRAKIIPFGLNYACRSLHSTLFLARLLAVHPKALRTMHFGPYVHLPTPEEIEWPSHSPSDPLILFQTRVWPDDGLGEGDTLENINGARVTLIRELRKAFGKRFEGGLVPDEVARKRYPDLVATLPHRRRAYAALSRRFMIAIYSRGLHGSHAFKLAEYLASSKCIVGEPLGGTLQYPLETGRNYIPFRAVDDCLAACDALLSNPAKANEMRRANWEYYQRYIRYDRRIELLANTHQEEPRPRPAHDGAGNSLGKKETELDFPYARQCESSNGPARARTTLHDQT